MTQFDTLPLAPPLLQVVAELGFTSLTPIQAQAIPVLLGGRDLVGQSRTGSGKTAAFALPILQRISLEDRSLQALVLCPTRELSAQVTRELRKLGRHQRGLQVLELAGGQPMGAQVKALERGAHVAVGTPGRVRDHLQRGTLQLAQVRTVVLDEADRMLDMGFQEDMEQILRAAPRERQTVFFSATYPRSIESMSRAFQRNPVQVSVAEEVEAAPDIEQWLQEVPTDDDKPAELLRVLAQEQPQSAIVFCNFKATTSALVRQLLDAGVSALALHGDLEQRDRDQVMARFRNGSTRVLLATDVAARGLDIANLDLVINYDLPLQPEVYVHRVGRTGRAGKAGLAISLATARDEGKVQDIQRATGVALRRQRATTSPEPAPVKLQQGAAMETLYISGGRKDKLRPGDILGALTGEAGGLKAEQVGKIEIHDHQAFVAVSREIASLAVQRLRAGKIKGRRFKVGIAH